ncbi:MAG: hypothetical protein WA935_01505 [Sphingopyxis granuli]
MEIDVDEPAEQQALFSRLLYEAAQRAEQILASAVEASRMRAVADDGYSAIERLEHSPLADDQMLALALRLSDRRTPGEPMEAVLDRHFRVDASPVAQEAQRRAVWRAIDANGLPIERASHAVANLERRLAGREGDLDRALRRHAALYSSLWCDPRIGASASARRVMLAMVSLLHEREVTPRFVPRGRRRAT